MKFEKYLRNCCSQSPYILFCNTHIYSIMFFTPLQQKLQTDSTSQPPPFRFGPPGRLQQFQQLLPALEQKNACGHGRVQAVHVWNDRNEEPVAGCFLRKLDRLHTQAMSLSTHYQRGGSIGPALVIDSRVHHGKLKPVAIRIRVRVRIVVLMLAVRTDPAVVSRFGMFVRHVNVWMTGFTAYFRAAAVVGNMHRHRFWKVIFNFVPCQAGEDGQAEMCTHRCPQNFRLPDINAAYEQQKERACRLSE